MQDGVTRDSPRRSKREPTNREDELGQDDRPGYDQEREERLEEADGSVDLPSEHAGHAARGAGHGAPGPVMTSMPATPRPYSAPWPSVLWP